MSVVREVNINGKVIRFEFNKFARQANGSVMMSCGDTQVLVAVCAADQAKEGQDFFPLTVDYIEKQYAAGRVPGGYLKRETKPGNLELLISRVIDRPLRPCFPEEFLCETTVTATVVSYDGENHPAPLAVIGASTALMISDIPFNGPVAALRIGMKDGQYILDPKTSDDLDLDLNMAARPGAVLMVEAGAHFLSEQQMIDAINYGHKLMDPIFELQREIQKSIGVAKRPLPDSAPINNLVAQIEPKIKGQLAEAFAISEKKARYKCLSEMQKAIMTEYNPDGDSTLNHQVNTAIEKVKSNFMRGMILNDKRRIDQRALTQIRPISCETKVLKRAHGSALFTRGETQALAAVTLAGADDSQNVDSITLPLGSTNRFMLHYNFPSFSVGESRPSRAPGRREIGHGALAERALAQVMPDVAEFGYTVRLVSEILESNGSSSMATVCGGCMALLDAGVPIKEMVAGIAMGLILEGNKFEILSDILGDEDHLGDMDFKVCGGEKGITALQMDIKVDGISTEILSRALEQAKAGRHHILGKMKEAIREPAELSEYAPRMFQIKIDESKIRDVIGPGGKMIKSIIAETGVKIDIADNGLVSIVSPSSTAAEAAKNKIRMLTTSPEIGQVYLGKVIKTLDFGAFIEIKPGLEGLCHISQLDDKRIARTEDVLREGEQVLVKVIDIDRQGKIKLSRKEAFGQKPTQ